MLFDHLVDISCDISLKILSLSSCHLVSTELGEWVMYILRALGFYIGPACLFADI